MFEDLVERSINIIRETRAQFKNPAVLFSTGKDSTVMLSLIREACFNEVPWPAIHLDTGLKFPEIYQFRDKVAKDWGINLLVTKGRGFKSQPSEKFKCCTERKTKALKRIISEHKFDAIIVGIRRDEHGIRNKERYMSPRDKNFEWKPYTVDDGKITSKQELELSGWGLFESDFGPETSHVRVHPILHWNEIDVWRYIQEKNLPVNPLYFSKNGKRYRSLGCMPCTLPIESNASSVEEIIEELKTSKTGEREGRSQDKEEQHMMERLRCLGYP